MLQGRRILIGLSGGIAAYKVCEAISTLAKAGAEVRAILTDAATEFITPLTVSTLCRHEAYTDAQFWQGNRGRPLHIELGEWAEVMAIAPLTANTLAKLAHGMADNLLTNTVLASTCPILLAPAMNTDMWQQPTVQRNWQQLQADSRYHAVAPEAGILACDRVGSGRMAAPSQIIAYLKSLLFTKGKRDFLNQEFLISAGGTFEYLDPVRFLGNPSSGKMGLALVRAAFHRGASVTLVRGTMEAGAIAELPPVRIIEATSADRVHRAMVDNLTDADWIVMAAAVADVKPARYSPEKLPKRSLGDAIPLAPVADIAAELGQLKQPNQRLIGFAAQTGDIMTPAREKLQRKHLDAIVANPVDRPNAGFGSNTNEAVLLDRHGRQQAIAPCDKLQLAHHLLDFLAVGS